ncbi:MAG: Lrp/AsnC family transcriptional regulator [Oscillospiraceae bacterium]|nr:Lrp/AsnC family transcriptional regulator [Oscillospiraceae bacterium]MBQ6846616.1 Lrp/AsnC family transcriptional regulator [Oscillospiraceae bacterium]MBQ7119047.1 Lrp/AsnC family transcriptional regulator [Oscillospiraceae bacterium]
MGVIALKNKILELLENDARMSAEQIASALSLGVSEVSAIIQEYEEKDIIAGYKTLIDWEKVGDEGVSAMIEIKVIPQRGHGFERIAERLSQYDEVESVYLMSGAYDIAVTVSGKTLREVACFVSDKIAPLEYVTSTATHFVLKKFKDKGIIYTNTEKNQERMYAF